MLILPICLMSQIESKDWTVKVMLFSVLNLQSVGKEC